MPAGSSHEDRNLLPVLTGQGKGPVHDALFWDGTEEKTAVRSGRWKLVNNRGKVELFDLDADPGEKTDQALAQPAVVAQLHQKFDGWSKANAPRMAKAAPTMKTKRLLRGAP